MVTWTRGSPEVKGTGEGIAREGECEIHGDHGTTIISHHVNHSSQRPIKDHIAHTNKQG